MVKNQPFGNLPGTLSVLDVSQQFQLLVLLLAPFIPHVSVLWSFYQCLACCNEDFSAPSVARFIVWSHYDAMSTCLNLRTPRTISLAHCLPCTMHASLRILASVSPCFCWYQRSWIVHASFVVSLQAFINSFFVPGSGLTQSEAYQYYLYCANERLCLLYLCGPSMPLQNLMEKTDTGWKTLRLLSHSSTSYRGY